METVNFEKYHGTGNDFILIDHRLELIREKEAFARKYCDRHFGIGSDGVIFLEKSDIAHFKMDFLNPDGSRSFCGNGSRCAVMFVAKATGQKGACTFEAIDGVHGAFCKEDSVVVDMLNTELPEEKCGGRFINTGSPHLVMFVDDVEKINLKSEGMELRYSNEFKPGGTNVNFVERTSSGIKMRTYERGVEDETLSCGTGVTAAALCASLAFKLNSPIAVETRGGNLTVHFENNNHEFTQIKLEGPVEVIFSGQIEI